MNCYRVRRHGEELDPSTGGYSPGSFNLTVATGGSAFIMAGFRIDVSRKLVTSCSRKRCALIYHLVLERQSCYFLAVTQTKYKTITFGNRVENTANTGR